MSADGSIPSCHTSKEGVYYVSYQDSGMDRTSEIIEWMKAVPTNKDYKFNEDKYLNEITQYVISTYNQHYAQSKYQATDTILDAGYGEGFCMGNIQKYWKRYGKKEGRNRKDLLKIIHYAIIQLYIHDQLEGE